MQKCPARTSLPTNATIAQGLQKLQSISQQYDECALRHNSLVDTVTAKEKVTNQP